MAYYWYMVTNDEYELPVTPVFDSSRELAEFLGVKRNTVLGFQSRMRKGRLSGKYKKYILAKVERIKEDE